MDRYGFVILFKSGNHITRYYESKVEIEKSLQMFAAAMKGKPGSTDDGLLYTAGREGLSSQSITRATEIEGVYWFKKEDEPPDELKKLQTEAMRLHIKEMAKDDWDRTDGE